VPIAKSQSSRFVCGSMASQRRRRLIGPP
jgi:hypothetical protein